MFDPRDLADDPRTRTPAKPKPTLDRSRERADRRRSGYRAEYDPRGGRTDIKTRSDRALAEIGIYRSVAYKDMSEAHFDSHPYATRRSVDRMIQRGDVEEHTAKGPQGGTYKVLTLTRQGAGRAEGVARSQGLDKEQKAWSGIVKPDELEHDTAVFRAARIEQVKLIEQGAVLKRVRIDAELKREVARASETARARGGKEAADRARLAKAQELGLPVKEGRVEIPDAQLEYEIDGRSGRVNVEVATGHYSGKTIAGKAAAGFAVHGSTHRAAAKVASSIGGKMVRSFGKGEDKGRAGGGGGSRDEPSIEI